MVAGDGQVSLGQTVIKSNATKVRRIADDKVVVGFAGATADAFTLFERLEAKLEQYPDQLTRACVELAKDWRTDRYLRRLEAMMAVADPRVSLILSGTGDVLEPEDGLIGIGSGGNYALAAARALMDREDMDAEAIARNHAFVDGNKRTAFFVASDFLDQNGYELQAAVDQEHADMMVELAQGKMTRADAAAHLRNHSIKTSAT